MSGVLLLRHGETAGNALGRYIGSTDESLSAAGRAQVLRLRVPEVARVYVSPLKRCMETARLVYPHLTPAPVAGLRECDFGAFENKSYLDLQGDARYQQWIDSGGTLPFPGGECRQAFVARCAVAFLSLDLRADAAIVAHGGTLMAIMSRFALPRRDYFDFQTRCASGFWCCWDGQNLTDARRLGGEQ